MTRAFVVTDIVGSTALVCQMGDRAFQGVMDRHDELVLDLLGRFGGHLSSHQGDGVLASFLSADDAFGWMVALRAAVVDALDIELHIGAHFGQARLRPRGYLGRSLHVVSRLAAGAAPGEMLLSGDFVRAMTQPEGGERSWRYLRGLDDLTEVYAIPASTLAGSVNLARTR